MSITRVGIVGLGAMGSGIAQVCLEAGLAVVGRDVEERLCARGAGLIEAGIARRVAKGALEQAAADAALAAFTTTTDLGGLAACELVIEAIVEELEPKRELFRALDGIVRRDAVLATNTSALPVTAIAAATAHPERVIGLHFFNPAPLMRLVEVVRTDLADPAVVAAGEAFARALGKEPVVAPDTPGFLVNRILVPVLCDAVRVLDETGVEPQAIDTAMKLGAGWPMGPLELSDLIGTDVMVHAADALWQATREPRFAPPVRLRRMLEAGRLGRKSGAGFYPYG